MKNPFEDLQNQAILGDNDFVARVRGEYLEKGSLREQPMYRDMVVERVDPAIVIECVTSVFGVSPEHVQGRYGSSVLRGIVSDLLYRYSGMMQREIGKYLGIDYSSVNKLRSRLRNRLVKDAIVARIKRQLSNV